MSTTTTTTTFAAPLSPLTARRPRVIGNAATTPNVNKHNTTKRMNTMILTDCMKRRLNTGFGALSAAIALSLTRIPGVITPYTSPSYTPVALAERVQSPSSQSIANSYSIATVLVARQSLQDLGDATQSTISDLTPSPINVIPREDGEFALSIRLCTACALGVLMGSEMGATSLALGMRALVVISLTSCLGTIYALLPPGAETTFLVQVVPPFAAPFVASAISLLGLLLFSTLQRLSRRRQGRPQLRRQKISRSAMTCGLVASAAGTGAACAAGQALPAVMFYLIALAICRSVPLPRPRGRKTRRGRRRYLPRELATVTSNIITPDTHTK